MKHLYLAGAAQADASQGCERLTTKMLRTLARRLEGDQEAFDHPVSLVPTRRILVGARFCGFTAQHAPVGSAHLWSLRWRCRC